VTVRKSDKGEEVGNIREEGEGKRGREETLGRGKRIGETRRGSLTKTQHRGSPPRFFHIVPLPPVHSRSPLQPSWGPGIGVRNHIP
jgi:hypothetical protein